MDFAIEWLRECFGILSRVLGADVVAYVANLLSAAISGGRSITRAGETGSSGSRREGTSRS